MVTESWDIF